MARDGRPRINTASLVVVGLMAAGIAAWACAASDPYYDDVAGISEDLGETKAAIMGRFVVDAGDCSLSEPACDRALNDLHDLAVEIRSAHSTTNQLTPPSRASEWHRDYLEFLDDYAQWADDTAYALEHDPQDGLGSLLDEADSLSRREDALIERFEDLR